LDQFLDEFDRLSAQDWTFHHLALRLRRESKTHTITKVFKSDFFVGHLPDPWQPESPLAAVLLCFDTPAVVKT
jgi:hypothetical protein